MSYDLDLLRPGSRGGIIRQFVGETRPPKTPSQSSALAKVMAIKPKFVRDVPRKSCLFACIRPISSFLRGNSFINDSQDQKLNFGLKNFVML